MARAGAEGVAITVRSGVKPLLAAFTSASRRSVETILDNEPTSQTVCGDLEVPIIKQDKLKSQMFGIRIDQQPNQLDDCVAGNTTREHRADMAERKLKPS